MDPYNLAVCFGPTLCPIPPNKDLVQHTNLVNDLIKNFIIFCHDIFNFEIDGPVYKGTQDEDNVDEHYNEKNSSKRSEAKETFVIQNQQSEPSPVQERNKIS